MSLQSYSKAWIIKETANEHQQHTLFLSTLSQQATDIADKAVLSGLVPCLISLIRAYH